MTGKKQLLSNYREEFQGTVRFGNDLFAPIVGRGDLVQEKLIIKDVSYVEGLGHNLFSIGKFCDKKLNVNFTDTRCSIQTKTGKELIAGTRTSDLSKPSTSARRRCLFTFQSCCKEGLVMASKTFSSKLFSDQQIGKT